MAGGGCGSANQGWIFLRHPQPPSAHSSLHQASCLAALSSLLGIDCVDWLLGEGFGTEEVGARHLVPAVGVPLCDQRVLLQLMMLPRDIPCSARARSEAVWKAWSRYRNADNSSEETTVLEAIRYLIVCQRANVNLLAQV